MKTSILIVEDDKAIQNLLAATLEANEYQCFTADNGERAIFFATVKRPDIMILDLGLPDIDGVEIITKVRSWSNCPILVVSARSEDSDKIMALDAGADDYLTKPFSMEELLARLRVAKRKIAELGRNSAEETSVFRNGGLEIDYAAAVVTVDGTPIHLTPMEYKLVCLLAKNTGRVLTHSYILKELWGEAYGSDVASLRVFMATLRRKIEAGTSGRKYIKTHVGVGYQMLRMEEKP